MCHLGCTCGQKGEDMQLGPGILWKKIDSKFKKEIMRDQCSLAALQWLEYRQHLDGMDSKGQFVQMQHNYHHGEVDFCGNKPDGYMFKDDQHIFFEFKGTSYHMYNILWFSYVTSIYISIKAAIGTVVPVYQSQGGILLQCNVKNLLNEKWHISDNLVM